jgi:hypothetical protein
MVCWAKLIGRLLVWQKRTVIANPCFCSPTRNPAWIAFDPTGASAKCWQS